MSGHFSGKTKEAKELEEDVKEKKVLFLTAFASTSKGYRFTTLSDNGSKIVTTIDMVYLIGTEVYDQLNAFISALNMFIEPKATFHARKFEVKKTDGMQMIYIEGTAPVGVLTADVKVDTFFDYESTKDMLRETPEDKAIFERTEQQNKVYRKFEEFSEFFRGNFLEYSGLAVSNQLGIFDN
ncbi:hypothetical protein [Runella salmonicolor]|uniref:Uncharacterized protein n=1 Tax=Runella salmonicolor TaxID=2950278 RepID=A0ABT1FT33_9BACT|nr:hypothetical protein [Runella salmonicolor]MCP1384862.1 hypothetical protein [Runella salmonicolor]